MCFFKILEFQKVSAIFGPLAAILDFKESVWRVYSARIKKLIMRKCFETANNLELDPFPDPVGHFETPGSHFGFRGL